MHEGVCTAAAVVDVLGIRGIHLTALADPGLELGRSSSWFVSAISDEEDCSTAYFVH